MKKTANKTTAKKSAPAPKLMKGTDVVVKCLENEGVDTIFAYPGGSIIDMHNALRARKK